MAPVNRSGGSVHPQESERPREVRADVAVVGGGPAGLAAALYTARYGLSTVVFDRGPSLLRQCAFLENYLGYPGGVDAATFLRLAGEQVEAAGAKSTRERVVSVERRARTTGQAAAPSEQVTFVRTRLSRTCPTELVVKTADGHTLRARRLIAASSNASQYLRGLAPSHPGASGWQPIDVSGRTAIPGVYVAGRLAGCINQALVCAGHGAQTALALIEDLRRHAGYRGELAEHLDWRIWKGVCEGEAWELRVRRHFGSSSASQPEAAEDPAPWLDAWIVTKRAQQLDRSEVCALRQRSLFVALDTTRRSSR